MSVKMRTKDQETDKLTGKFHAGKRQQSKMVKTHT